MPLSYALLVFPEIKLELSEAIQEVLENSPFTGEHPVAVLWAKDEATANDFLRGRTFHLVITGLQIPPSRGSPLNPKEERGLHLAQTLSQDYPSVSSIVVASSINDRLSCLVQALPHCELILEGENFFRDLLRLCQRFLGIETQAEQLQANIDIGINLGTVIQNRWVTGYYTITGVNWAYSSDPGPITLDFNTLTKLAKKSKLLEDEPGWPRWEEELRFVGADLRKELVEANELFRQRFKDIVKKVGGLENIRIRFRIALEQPEEEDRVLFSGKEDELHEVVLEALLGEQKEFLMLQAPICRRVDIVYCGQYPLFHKKIKDEPMTCLIIEADTSGFVPKLKRKGEQVSLKSLSYLREESEALKEYLENQRLVRKIVRIDKDTDLENLTYKDYVLKTLEEGKPWHLVHYVGHSLYDDEGVGYVFFPKDRGLEPLKIKEFSAAISNTDPRFVYLSSCYSSGADFVFQLANNQVPAILGFRWRIDDDKALEYAKAFYQKLFERKHLLKAFLEARRCIHDKYEDNKIWAAPLLIMQICEDYD